MIELKKEQYKILIPHLKKIDFNHLFALAVVEKKVNGVIYVDSELEPTIFYIKHPYGLSLLIGKLKNNLFAEKFKADLIRAERERFEAIQLFPARLNDEFRKLVDGHLEKWDDKQTQNKKIVECVRVNFLFNKEKYEMFKHSNKRNDVQIVRTDKDLYLKMSGSVVPKYFWRNAEHFENSGIGFSVLDNGELASTAYSAFIQGNQLEIGIETIKQFYGKGYAATCCSKLIDYCLKNNYEPVWSCKYENTASFKLAQTLGFEPIRYLPAYYIEVL